MTLAILIMLALFAFIAWAPEQLTQAALALAWAGGALSIVATLLYGLGRLLSSRITAASPGINCAR